jgi:outer membrane protein insertion porin family
MNRIKGEGFAMRSLATAVMTVTLLVCLAEVSLGQQEKVKSVTVTGVSGEDLKAAQRAVRSRAGDAYSEKTAQEDTLELLKLPFVENAKARQAVTPEGVELTYEITARGKVTGINFVGNKKFKAKKLLKEGQLEGATNYDMARFSAARDLIIDKYKKAGYLFVKVDFGTQPDESVLFKVDEGPRLKVTTVNILGNTVFTDKLLKKQIKTRTKKYLILAYRFDETTAEDDRLRLQEYYRERGYLDAKVAVSLDLTKNRKGIIVDYVIIEGPLYTVRSIAVSGNAVIPSSRLEAVLKMGKGAAFCSPRLDDDLRALKLEYGKLGYIDCVVAPAPLFAEKTPEVDLTYRISEGGPIQVGEVEIVGNDKTRDNVIRRDLEFFPGETYDMGKLELSKRNLRRLAYFSKVEVEPDQALAGTTPRNATVTVAETSTGRFMVGVAVNSNAGLMGNVTFQQRNFDYRRPPKSWKDVRDGRAWTGGGQTFELDAMPGTEVSQARVRYNDPRLDDSDYSLGLEFHLWQRERDTYTERRVGPDVSFGKRISRNAFWETGFGADTVRISDLDFDAPPDASAVHGTSQVDTVRFTLGHDTRDNVVVPTEGRRLAGTVEASTSAIGSDFDFLRVRLDGNWYRTVKRDKLDRSFILSWRGRVSQMFPRSDSNAPIFERLYVGGAYDVRGFEYRGLGPHFGDEPLGGRFAALGGVQYEVPLAAEFLRGAIFYDTGTLVSETGDLSLDKVRHTLGVGVRFVIPPPFNMPVDLDFGFPIKKEDDDQTQVISFSIGRTM